MKVSLIVLTATNNKLSLSTISLTNSYTMIYIYFFELIIRYKHQNTSLYLVINVFKNSLPHSDFIS